MSYDEYWYGEAELFWAYRQAYLNKVEQDIEFANYKSWLSGLYNFIAYGTVESNMNRKEGEEPISYIEKPIDFTEQARLEAQQKKEEEEKLRKIQAEVQLKNLLSKYKKKIEEKKKE